MVAQNSLAIEECLHSYTRCSHPMLDFVFEVFHIHLHDMGRTVPFNPHTIQPFIHNRLPDDLVYFHALLAIPRSNHAVGDGLEVIHSQSRHSLDLGNGFPGSIDLLMGVTLIFIRPSAGLSGGKRPDGIRV